MDKNGDKNKLFCDLYTCKHNEKNWIVSKLEKYECWYTGIGGVVLKNEPMSESENFLFCQMFEYVDKT